MESEEVVTVDEEQCENLNPEQEESNIVEKKGIETLLPLSRIKKICKLDPDVHMLTSDALKVVTFSAERFVECIAKEASLVSREDGRKTVQLKDIERAIRRNPLFEFLEDALSDWPEGEASREGVPSHNTENEGDINEQEGNVAPDDEMDTEEPELLDETPVEESLSQPSSVPIRDIEDL